MPVVQALSTLSAGGVANAHLQAYPPVRRTRTVTIPHEPGTPHYPEDPDWMEARLIEEIVQIQAALGR
jgi:hypothetical protein